MTDTEKILIVDDRPENLFALRKTLAMTEAQVIEAGSANEALTASLNHDFALAILDVNMPEMDGFELAEFLRAEEKTRHLPIIFLTAVCADDHHVFRGYEAGGVDYIVKPYKPMVLLNKVEVFLDLARVNNELRQKNESLEAEVARRRNAERAVTELNVDLERRVEARTAELQTLNEELQVFTYSVSHDLRAPLRAIQAYVNAVLEDHTDSLAEEAMELLGHAIAASTRMVRLIDDLLSLSRAASAELHREWVDISALARQVVHELKRSAPKDSIEVVIQDGMTAYGDQTLLLLVMQNLIGNAWKFSAQDRTGRVDVGWSGDAQTFFVKDNGVGFDERYAHKLFEPFARLHSEDEFPGSGVGLATVQRIIRRHGGDVRAESELGGGTTLFFEVPRDTDDKQGGRQ